MTAQISRVLPIGSGRRQRRGHLAGRSANALVVALAVWLAWLSVRYVTGTAVMRFRVESAALLFALVGVLVRINHDRETVAANARVSMHLPEWTLPLCWCLAIALYAPTIGIGFLSDDFVLADRASSGRVGFVTPQLFRPVPLALWGAILRAGGGPNAIHLLNVLLHGTNAYLAGRFAEPYVRNIFPMLLACAIALTFPLAPEAVAWAAGMFDVLATTFVFLGVLAARKCRRLPSVGRRATLYAYAALALFSKETAAVLPLLILLDMSATRRWSKTVAADACCLLAAVIAIAVVRLHDASPVMKEPITKFTLQRWLFDTFGSAVLPWHQNVSDTHPGIVVVGVLACVVLTAIFFLSVGTREDTHGVAAMAGVMLVGTLPVIQLLGVAHDLQGARYLYLPGMGWAGLIACVTSAVSERRTLGSRLAGIGAVVLIGTYVVMMPAHLIPWRRAADLRERVERAALTNPLITRCRTIDISSLPGNFQGAYVFGNGASEAFRRDLGKGVSQEVTAECSFRWDDASEDFVPSNR